MTTALRLFLSSLAFTVALATSLHADTVADSLEQLRAVGPEGEGNAEAAEAWDALVAEGPGILLPTLEAMDAAGPLARNWMRTAVETAFARAREDGADLPAAAMRGFILDRDNDPAARELAFDLYDRLAPEKAEALVPKMIDDPNPALRRGAVAEKIAAGREKLEAGKTEKAAEVLTRALDAARDVDQVDAVAKLLREKLDREVDLPRHFGFLMHWRLAAPFDNADLVGFERTYPPEGGVDLDATYEGKNGREVEWQEYATADDYGMVDFNDPYSPLKGVVGYAYTEFHAEEARDAQLRLGCKNAWKVWFNGEFFFGRDEYHRGMRIDQYTLPVRLKKGKNTILVKACQNEQDQRWTRQWQFQLRVCDRTGTAILSTDRPPTPEPEPKRSRRRSE